MAKDFIFSMRVGNPTVLSYRSKAETFERKVPSGGDKTFLALQNRDSSSGNYMYSQIDFHPE